jgi:hypothetical protein
MTRLRFHEIPYHRYYLADPQTGKMQQVPSVSGLVKRVDPMDFSHTTIKRVCAGIDAYWDDLAALDRSQRIDELINVATRADRKAMDFGTEVHRFAEQLWTGEAMEVPERYAAHMRGLAQWWDDYHPRLVAAERFVFSDPDEDEGLCGYAGRCDLIIDLGRLGVGLVDLKTGNGIYPGYAAQLAGYAAAQWHVVDGQDVPAPLMRWLGVLHVTAGGSTLHTLPRESWQLAEQQFTAAHAIKHIPTPGFQKDTSR